MFIFVFAVDLTLTVTVLYLKSTIRRIYSFRDRDEHRKTLKNRYLTRLKGLAINRKRSAESDE